MSRPLRVAGYIATGIIAGLLVAVMAISLLTRTDWGMERARRFAVSWLADRVNGTLHIGRITGRGLLGGMIIHDFGITDPRGRPFLRTDSLELLYDWKTLVSGRIDLQRVVLHRPQAVLEILPGDTLWNFQIIFPDTMPGDSTRTRQLIRFADTHIRDGSAIVRLGLHPDNPISVMDTARAILERVPGGTARVMRFEQLNAHLDRVIWESPLEKGRLFDIRSLQGRSYVWRDPFIVRQARGTLTLLDSIVSFDMPEVSLPNSRTAIIGQVIRTAGGNRFDVRIEGERLQLADLQFLHPNLPREGGGTVLLRIKSQPDGILWLAENAQFSTPGSRLAGTVGVVTGDTMYFTRVNLTASPLDVSLLERILPGGLPVDGLLIGTVEVRGPISALETRGDMQLEPRDGGNSSHVAWRGVLDARRGISARSMHAAVKHLELSLLSAFNPALQLRGSVSGSVDASGSAERMSFTGLLEHLSHEGGRATFDGGGSVSGRSRSRLIDIAVNASSVTLQDLAQQIPALQGLQGELKGPVRLHGSTQDLAFDAQLLTPGGLLDIEGRLRGGADDRRISALAEGSGFRIDALRAGLPAIVASGRVRFDVAGREFGSAVGTVRLELDSTRLGDLPGASVIVDGTLDHGIFQVDSARWRTSFATATAAGTVALLEGRDGRLDIDFSSRSLARLEPYLFRDTARTDAEPRLAGRIDGSASLTGWLGDLVLAVDARADHLIYRGIEAARLDVELDLRRRSGAAAAFQLAATADSLALWSHPLRTARVEATGAGDSITVVARAAHGAQELIAARGAVRADPSAGATALRVDELRVGGAAPWLLAAPVTVAVTAGGARVEHVEFVRAAGGRAVASGRLAWTDRARPEPLPLDFSLDLTGVPFTELLRALRSRASGGGAMSASMRVLGTAADPRIEATIDARDIQYGDVRLDRVYGDIDYAALRLDAHAEAQYGGRSVLSGGGTIPIDLRFAGVGERRLAAPLHVTLSADRLPPALPLALLEGFSATAGSIDGNVTFAGTTLDPALSGGFRVTDGAALWAVSGVRYHDVNGTLALEDDRLIRIDLSARAVDARSAVLRTLAAAAGGGATGGDGTIRGTLDLTVPRDPRFELRFTANRAYAVRRRDVEATVSGEVFLHGRYRRPELSGALRVDDGALYLEEIYRQYLIGGIELDDPSLISLVDTSLVAVRPLLSTSRNPFLRGLLVRNLALHVGADSWLRSREMDVEVRGDLNVAFDMLQEDLRLTGTLDVQRGTYTLTYPPLQSRRFQVREGSIVFLGTPGMNPNLAFTAGYKARDSRGEPLDILAIVSGTLQSPRVRLASDAQQQIGESDLASYLFFGVPTWQVNTTGGVTSPGAVAGLGMSVLAPSVLGYASSGLQTLVQNAGWLDYVAFTAADVAPQHAGATGFGSFLAGTQLELGSYITSDLFVGYSQRLNATSIDPVMRLQWQFQPEYSFEFFAEDRLARTPGFGVRPESGLKRVWGLALFREWGF